MESSSLMNRLYWPIKYLIRWRWGIIGLIGFLLLILEIGEQASLDDIHLGDILIFLILLIFIGGLVELLLRNLNEKDHANMILDVKHDFSQNLALIDDLVDLNVCVLDFLSSITQPLMSSISVKHPSPENHKTVINWEPGEAGQEYQHMFDPLADCSPDEMDSLEITKAVTTFQIGEDGSEKQEIYSYCLPLIYGTSIVGLLRFMLIPGSSLKPSQLEIVQNICTEIAIAIKSIQQTEALSEASINQALLEERHEISRDLHDILGHNIGYLRLKLDQFSQDGFQGEFSQSRAELIQMRDVADESYDLVRGVLVTLHPTVPLPIANLLLDHIRSKSREDGFEYKFTTEGNPVPLTSNARRQIFFVFIEAMRNASKYSNAHNVEVNLFWGVDDFAIKIHDDGSGFDPDSRQTNHHFGITIMKERIETLGGEFSITSAVDQGTDIKFSIPLEDIQAAPKDEDEMQAVPIVNQ